MADRARELTQTSKQASWEVDAAAHTLDERSKELTGSTENALARLARVASSLTMRSEEATKATDQNVSKLDMVGKKLQDYSQESANSAEQIVGEIDSAHGALRQRMRELMDAYYNTKVGMEALGETLGKRAQDVGTISAQAISKVEAWDKSVESHVDALLKSSSKVAHHGQAVTKALSGQTVELKEASQTAQTLVASLKSQTDKVAMDDFLHRATFILERLQSVAVDMNRVLETNISEDDWARFNRGEKGVFVRKMLGFREKGRLAAIQQKFQEDGEFREYVNRYMTQFAEMLAEARKRDHDGVLSTTFLSSDMGKVYMILSRALGRDV